MLCKIKVPQRYWQKKQMDILYKAYGIALPKVLDKFEKTYGIKIYRDLELP